MSTSRRLANKLIFSPSIKKIAKMVLSFAIDVAKEHEKRILSFDRE